MNALWLEARSTWAATLEFLSTWGMRFLAVLLLAVVLYAVYRIVARLLNRLTPDPGDGPAVLYGVRGLLGLTLLAVYLVITASLFPLTTRFTGSLVRVYLIGVLLLVGWNFLNWLLRRTFTRLNLDASLEQLLRNAVYVVWFALGLYLVFQQFGINLLPVLGGLGIVGVALGFAAQDLLSNLIAGITLLLDRPFTIGDWVRVNDFEGQVVRVTLRTTRMRTRDNELISVPNSKIAGNDVVNLTAGGPLRVRTAIGIAYGADLDLARSTLTAVMQAEPLVLPEPEPRVAVMQLADSSVNLDLIYWIAADSIPRRPLAQQRVLEAAKRALDAAGVEIPFPQRVLHIPGLPVARPAEHDGPPR